MLMVRSAWYFICLEEYNFCNDLYYSFTHAFVKNKWKSDLILQASGRYTCIDAIFEDTYWSRKYVGGTIFPIAVDWARDSSALKFMWNSRRSSTYVHTRALANPSFAFDICRRYRALFVPRCCRIHRGCRFCIHRRLRGRRDALSFG